MFVTFARTEIDGKDRHTAFILEKGMEGFEVGHRYDTMGLRGNDLRPLYFKDVRVPPENVLGEPGEGFRIAMHVLNNGRLSLGTGLGRRGQVAARRGDRSRQRSGASSASPLADFELVQEKIGWMVSYLFGLESMAYLTTGLVDAGVPDYSLESAICKVAGTEFLWYQANRALQLKGGAGLHARPALREGPARHPHLPDLRGRQRRAARVHRALGHEAAGRQADRSSATSTSRDPIGSLGVLADYVGGRIQREVRPDRVTRAHAELDPLAEPLSATRSSSCATSPSRCCASTRKDVMRAPVPAEAPGRRGGRHLRADRGALASHVDLRGPRRRAVGQERYIAETFCTRAAGRVRSRFDQIEHNDDERMSAIAKLAYKRGEYGYAFFED